MTDRLVLDPFGWDQTREDELAAAVAALGASLVDDAAPRPGRIVRVDRGECDVVTERGNERAVSDSTRAQGAVAPAVGDWVVVADDELGERRTPVVAAVLARRHTLARRDPSERIIEQVLVANVDVVAMVFGLDRPLPPGRLERSLVLAWDSGARPVVVLTKADLGDADPSLLADRRADVAALAADVTVLATSRVDGRGVAELRGLVPEGATLALLGESGAGKSNLVNLLLDDAVADIGAVRSRDRKGRHTTVARELRRIPGHGCVVDTPGIRAVGLWASAHTLERVFHDIDELAVVCRFADCADDREPGCAVLAAAESGALDPRRLARYRALRDELAEQAEREASRARRKN